MKVQTVEQAAERAADFMYHWMYDMGSVMGECVQSAKEIYYALLEEELDVESVLGFSEEEIEEQEKEDKYYV